jgi:NADH:ubiquinone oxidoreductase subunit 4 (subunit M)
MDTHSDGVHADSAGVEHQSCACGGHGHKIVDVPGGMKVALGVLVVLVVVIGIYPTFFLDLIQTVTFGGLLS